MKKIKINPLNQIFLFSLGTLLSFSANSQSLAVPLIDEDFSDLSDWIDLSTAVTWGDHSEPVSAFTTDGNSVFLQDEAFAYTDYQNQNSLKTFTALDRQFISPVAHSSNILTIDFRARWNSVDNNDNNGHGEYGRFLVIVNYDYPAEGLNTNLNDKYNDFDSAWWARPAYHLRLRSADNIPGTTLLQYGGGLTSQGEYERFGEQWWLPGFISGALEVRPGWGVEYPQNSWVETKKGVATTSFRNYRYVIKPDAQEFWFDANDDGIFQSEELEARMPLPMVNEANAPLYQYFPMFEGIRLYWRGSGSKERGQVFLDRLTVTVEPVNPVD